MRRYAAAAGVEPADVAIATLERIRSPQRKNRRDIDVYLPPWYRRGRGRYPVIYMQDGQNLSDPATAFAGTWELPATLAALAERGVEAIVVGVPNVGKDRFLEYGPFVDRRHGGGEADAYLDFLVSTVKPIVDRRFRTRPNRASTGLLGSSMGGLVSLYGFFRRSDVFGFAGAMSPSLWFGGRAIFPFVEQASAHPGRIYLDAGTEEGGGTLRDAREMAALLRRKGYRTRRSLRYVEAKGGRHSEAHWRDRLEPALAFLLGRL
jgi:predicted alpha/beta superfamily hydrolase